MNLASKYFELSQLKDFNQSTLFAIVVVEQEALDYCFTVKKRQLLQLEIVTPPSRILMIQADKFGRIEQLFEDKIY